MMATKSNYLMDMIAAQKKGALKGIYSVCSANRFVIEAGVKQAQQDRSVLLVESTSNQVDQYGGYIGMTPKQFSQYVWNIASGLGLHPERVILGGDHLGPNVWQKESVASAMAKARVLVQECVLAGYSKIHLDASMKCGDDDPEKPLSRNIIADRSAELCLAAEEAFLRQLPVEATSFLSVQSVPKIRYHSHLIGPVYVIGSEVPLPGGAHEKESQVTVTRVEDAEETIQVTKDAFVKRGLGQAWERVIALVVQPGVEFGDDFVLEYNPVQASGLSHFIESCDHLVFEAHSTDYQRRGILRKMVEDHFAILKVGPGLTFAFREAILALALIEQEWLAGKSSVSLSNIMETLEQVMLADPSHWRKHYSGEKTELRCSRKYSYSDRIRYYWPTPAVQSALKILLDNLERNPIPLMLLSQYLPVQYTRVREGLIASSPNELIHDKIASVMADYSYACGLSGEK